MELCNFPSTRLQSHQQHHAAPKSH